MEDTSTGGVRIVSRRAVQPDPASSPDFAASSETQTTMELTPWDLRYISVHYIQKGVLLPATTQQATGTGSALADDLASSFARALGRFYPLTGRFVVTEMPGGGVARLAVSLRCSDDGAEFVHAMAPEVSASDIISTSPPVLRSFFPLNGMLCGDAMLEPRLPVLAAQVTELADGAIFVAMSLNHVAADGTTFWHLFNTWSEIHRSGGRGEMLFTPPPVLSRWFPESCPVPVTLPFGKVPDILRRIGFPLVGECFFHFSAASVRCLKDKANADIAACMAPALAVPPPQVVTTVSSLQAVLAHIWRGTCRARCLPPDRETTFLQPVGCRGRVRGVPRHYVGNAVARSVSMCTVGHVLQDDRGLGCVAALLTQAVASFDEAKTRDALVSWHEKPNILYLEEASGDGGDPPAHIVVAGSPRFDVYGNDFGWGAPVIVRSGAGNKMDGLVTVYPGRDGGGSIGVEVCLSPEALTRLTADREFMEVLDMA